MGAIGKFSAIIAGLLGILFTIFLSFRVLEENPGNTKMQKISKLIQDGAKSFLKSEYKILFSIIIIFTIFLSLTNNYFMGIAFLLGAILSASAGYFGMFIATRTNTRTANAALSSLNKSLKIAFNGGSTVGMCVVSLGLLGIGFVFLISHGNSIIMSGYAMGASFVALFARVGGGIFTKAADVGADLVGKTEACIPEDDPRNPAVIADNVGDNVGDVAGMSADLFESYVGSIFSASVLGSIVYNYKGAIFPFIITSIGIITSIIGVFFVNLLTKSSKTIDPSKRLHAGTNLSNLLQIVIVIVFSKILFNSYKPSLVIIFGIIGGTLIGKFTEYYTSKKPVLSLAKSSQSGAAPVIINGMALGMKSTFFSVIIIAIITILDYKLIGLYGIALSGVGMLSTLGITLAVDAYGPIADNAGGIAEMSHLDPKVREITDKLDSVGNTTAAMGKGFAIGSAALTALALFASYTKAVSISEVNLNDPKVFVGLLIGGMLPFLFSAFAMKAVGDSADIMVNEVRRQFKEIPGLMDNKNEPDYNKCISIATYGALKKMVLPSLIAVFSPIIVFSLLGKTAVAGTLAGTTISGVMLAIFMANSGGAWDNAKKHIEEGNFGGKGSLSHKASIIGDTVGDPFKDTAGPSINILIKLMSIVSIVIIPILLKIK